MIERELETLERSVAPRPPTWAWSLVVVGFVVAIALAAQAVSSYTAIARINAISHLETPNPMELFQELATNGPRVTAAVDANSRGAYGQALTHYVLDGTGICLAIALAFAGLFIRINR